MRKLQLIITVVLILAASSCKDRYLPRIPDTDLNLLVVEGTLDAGGGPTTFRLTRSARVDYARNIEPELNAQVTVEGKDNSIQQLPGIGDGLYRSLGLQMTIGQEYRLRIQTSGGKEYLSDYVVAKKTPAIDTTGFKPGLNGMIIHANAHDETGGTRYYRWEYDETWEINSSFYSKYIWDDRQVRLRRMPEEEVYYCWKYGSSTNIIIGTSTRLVEDRISEAPLLVIPYGNEKLSVRYSIMLRQYALDKRGYEFYELMKKNTESLGSIFDAQPTEIIGNIVCVNDPKELVIGYVNCSTISEKRTFITRAQADWDYNPYCPIAAVPLDSLEHYFAGGGHIPYDVLLNPETERIERYLASYAGCVDCTVAGGTKVKPSYW